MGLLIQTIVFGLLLGTIYGLASMGLTLTFGVMKIVNLVHGSLLILGGYVTYTVWSTLGLDPILSIVITAPVVGAVGWLLYQGLVRPSIPGGEGGPMIITFALLLAFGGILALIWGHNPLTVAPPYARTSWIIGDIVAPHALLFGALATIVILVALWAVMRFTWFGRALRAAAANPAGARLVGINVPRVNALAYALGAATAGAAGALISVAYPLTVDQPFVWLARTIAIVVLGGLGSLPGTVIGALIIGLLETFVSAYVSLTWTVAVPFVVIIAVLLIKPSGLLGARSRSDVVDA